MRIGIIAPSDLQSFWEQHLRTFQSVREVVMVTKTDALPDVDACLFGASTDNPVEEALSLLKHSIHLMWLLPLPGSVNIANRFIKVAEESGAVAQFICWSVHTPALQKMMQLIAHPQRILIRRNLPHQEFIKSRISPGQLNQEEIAYCCYWVNHSLYDVHIARMPDTQDHSAISMTDILFANGTRCSIHVDTVAKNHEHIRCISNTGLLLRHDVTENKVVRIDAGHDRDIRIIPETLPETPPARHALTTFFRSISRPSFRIFDPHELKRYCRVTEALQRKSTR